MGFSGERYKHRDPSHQLVFDRIEDLKLVNCTHQYFGKLVQTNQGWYVLSARPALSQEHDYSFESVSLGMANLVACQGGKLYVFGH